MSAVETDATTSENSEALPAIEPAPRSLNPRTPAPRDEADRRLRGKKMMDRRIALALGMVVFVVGVAAGGIIEKRRKDAEKIIFAVNGRTVNQDAFVARLESLNGAAVLQQMKQETLWIDFAAKRNCLPSTAQVQSAMWLLRHTPGFSQAIAEAGKTPYQVRRDVYVQLAQQNVYAQGVNVTDVMARDYYEKNISSTNRNARYYNPESIQLSGIQCATEDQAAAALLALTRSVSWDTVWQEYSFKRNKSMGPNGRLPLIIRGRTELADEKLIPNLDQMIFSLIPGQWSRPLHMFKSWWILRCENKTLPSTDPWDKVKLDARNTVAYEIGFRRNAKKVQVDFAAFEKAAVIQVFKPAYSSVLNNP